jgi:integrase
MPIRIVKARNKKTKNLYVRGTYLGVTVDRSCRTTKRSVARQLRADIEAAIERGEYPARQKAPARSEQQLTFLSAALAYLKAGKRKRYVNKLIRYFGEKPVVEFDQATIDAAAVALYPGCTGGTWNACVYTPISAILRYAGVPLTLKRPKGAKGRLVTDWLVQDDAFGIIDAADGFDPELGTLLRFLLYTGVRLGEALNLQREDIRLYQARAWVRHEKGQPAADVRLREDLCQALAAHLETHGNRRVFRFHQGGHLKHQLLRAKFAYLGLPCPARRPQGWRAPAYRLAWVNFHSFRHTWATWMRQHGATVDDLVDSRNWRDRRSAGRYVHAAAEGVWERVDLLPSVGKIRGETIR